MANKDKESPAVHDQLTALGHQLRRLILRCIRSADEPVSPREISGELNQPLSNVSYHVRVLAECDAITLVKTKPVRGSMQHFYRVHPSFIGEKWIADVLGSEPTAGTA